MNTTTIRYLGPQKAHLPWTQWIDLLSVPLEAWSVRRRWLAAALIALTVLALGANGWTSADLSGLQASRDALADTQHKLSDARTALAQLPALRRDASSVHAPTNWTSADDVRVISQLAARNEVTLLTVEPGAAVGNAKDTMRPLHLTAQADFDHMMDFLEGLASLPVLIVPAELTLKQQREGLSINATLNSFGALHPVVNVGRRSLRADSDTLDPEDEIVFYDPFALSSSTPSLDANALPMRLVGLLADLSRGLALIDTDEGAMTLEAGEKWGGESVAHVDAHALTFAKHDGGARSLTLAEAGE